MKELDALLSLLAERKRILEQEEAERNMQILLDLLQYLRKQRVDELKEVRRYSAHFSGILAINLDLMVFNVLFFLKKLSFGA